MQRLAFRLVTIVAAALIVLLAPPAGVSVAAPPPGVIPEHYIVVPKDSAGSPAAVANEHARDHAAAVSFVYQDALQGYAARIPSQRLAAVQADPRVKYVVADGEVSIAGQPGDEVSIAAETLPWGVDRIGADASSTLAGNGSGAGNVNAYVIDTGDRAHPDLTR